jgi:FkbM family methyltransferase
VIFLFRLRKLFAILRVAMWRSALLRWGVAAGMEHARVLANIGEIRTVVDVGANRGQFALAARHCFPESVIISFEPLSGPAKTYASVFRLDGRASLRQVAIGPRSGEALIHVSRRDDASSLLPISEEQERVFPGTRGIGTATIAVATLGEHVGTSDLHGPALLKLDVQGFELDALRGCESLLDRFDWVYVECSFRELYEGQALADEVMAWLRERAFSLRGLYNATYDRRGCVVQADFLFGRSRR